MIIIIMTRPHYKNGKSMIIIAWYKNVKSKMTSLIIMKIKFVYF